MIFSSYMLFYRGSMSQLRFIQITSPFLSSFPFIFSLFLPFLSFDSLYRVYFFSKSLFKLSFIILGRYYDSPSAQRAQRARPRRLPSFQGRAREAQGPRRLQEELRRQVPKCLHWYLFFHCSFHLLLFLFLVPQLYPSWYFQNASTGTFSSLPLSISFFSF